MLWVVAGIVLLSIIGAGVSCAYGQGMFGSNTAQVDPNGDSALVHPLDSDHNPVEMGEPSTEPPASTPVETLQLDRAPLARLSPIGDASIPPRNGPDSNDETVDDENVDNENVDNENVDNVETCPGADNDESRTAPVWQHPCFEQKIRLRSYSCLRQVCRKLWIILSVYVTGCGTG